MEIFTDVIRNTYLGLNSYIFPDLYFNKISSSSHKRTFVISVLFKSQLAAELWKNNKQRSPAFIAVSFVLRTEAAVRDTVFPDLLGFFYWHQSGLLLLRCLLAGLQLSLLVLAGASSLLIYQRAVTVGQVGPNPVLVLVFLCSPQFSSCNFQSKQSPAWDCCSG